MAYSRPIETTITTSLAVSVANTVVEAEKIILNLSVFNVFVMLELPQSENFGSKHVQIFILRLGQSNFGEIIRKFECVIATEQSPEFASYDEKLFMRPSSSRGPGHILLAPWISRMIT